MFFGILSIYSAGTIRAGGEISTASNYLKQIIWILVCVVNMIIILKTPMHIMESFVLPLYGISILLLLGVFLMPRINGSHRWFIMGPLRLQPSELAKITTILLVARLLSKPHITYMQMVIRGLTCTIIPVILIILEPDLGTTLVYWVSLTAMLSIAGLPNCFLIIAASPILSIINSFYLPAIIIFIILLGIYLFIKKFQATFIAFILIINIFFAVFSPLMWNSLRPYQQARILTFLNPLRDPLGAGYQIIQAKIAIGSGGITGQGFLSGTQKNLQFLPEQKTDFIFAVIGEELGFAGCALLIFLFFLLLMRIIKQAAKIKICERRIAAGGIFAYLAFQIIINIGMNLGLVPTTGIPLPFISYGGSNLVINSLGISIILKYLLEREFVR